MPIHDDVEVVRDPLEEAAHQFAKFLYELYKESTTYRPAEGSLSDSQEN